MWQHYLMIYILIRYAFKDNKISTAYKNIVWWQLTQLCWILKSDIRI